MCLNTFPSENTDYTAVSENVVFPANSPVGSQQCFTLSIINDVRKEDDETFTLTASVSDPNCPSPGNVVVTIIDTDSKYRCMILYSVSN